VYYAQGPPASIDVIPDCQGAQSALLVQITWLRETHIAFETPTASLNQRGRYHPRQIRRWET
jgi:hypothetical protein